MTRKEATERIKARFDKWALDDEDMKAIQIIIPELTESEDERTRKGMIHFLESEQAEGIFTYEARQSWIAYLEKQKDLDKMIAVSPEVWDNAISDAFENGKKEGEKQKESMPIPNKFSGLKSLMLQYFDSAVHRNDDAEIESDTDLWGRKILDYVWKHDEKQKEQKQEWSENDELMMKAVIGILDESDHPKLCSWLKSLRPQKLDASKLENFDPVDVLNRIKTEWPMAWEKVVGKQEWSEEDEKNLELVIDCIYEYYPDPVKKYKLKDWLKFLRPQKKEDLPKWRKWRNGGCGNVYGFPIAIVKSGTGYELVSSLGIEGQEYIMISDLEKLPKEK